MSYLFYIFFGVAPSLIWLSFFLRKDSHPESNRMILKIFIYGIMIALVAAFIEIGLLFRLSEITNQWFKLILYHFIGIALVEEFLKYSVVKEKVLNNPEFDEPVDAMLYMIIAALGFAALENILVLLPPLLPNLFTVIIEPSLKKMVMISSFRFIGATFLHALCSGAIGYFLALSLYESKRRFSLIALGIIIATLLHGVYNFSIIKISENFYFVFIPIILLISLALFVSFGFRKLKKLSSICKPSS